jgi:cytochrome c1
MARSSLGRFTDPLVAQFIPKQKAVVAYLKQLENPHPARLTEGDYHPY